MNRRPYATRKVSKEEYEEDLKRREESAERAKEWVAKKFANPLDELTAKWEKCEKENNGHIYGVVGDEEGLLRKRKMVRVRCVACNYQYLAEPETTQKLPEFWDELGRWSGLQGLSIACRAILDDIDAKETGQKATYVIQGNHLVQPKTDLWRGHRKAHTKGCWDHRHDEDMKRYLCYCSCSVCGHRKA